MKITTKKMQIYTAHDGSEFHDQDECLVHEAKDPANAIATLFGVDRDRVIAALGEPGGAQAFMKFGADARKQLVDAGEIKPRGRKAAETAAAE